MESLAIFLLGVVVGFALAIKKNMRKASSILNYLTPLDILRAEKRKAANDENRN